MDGVATLHVRNVPDWLYEELRNRAERHGRSIGGETVTIMEQALCEPSRPAGGLRGRFRRSRARPATPFDRFTDRARRTITLAQHEADELRHGYVGTEHILLGLLGVEDGLAARALRSLQIDAGNVRRQVREIVGEGKEGPAPPQRPFTPRAKKVLELALNEAHSLGHNYVGTEHLLLGLAREDEGLAARILLDLGADAAGIRDAVLSMLAGNASGSWREALERPEAPSVGDGPEYRVVALEGQADAWAEQLNAAAADGWELLELLAVGREHRAVLTRQRG